MGYHPQGTEESQGSPSQAAVPNKETQGAVVPEEVIEVEAPKTSKKAKKMTKKDKGNGKIKENKVWSKEMADFLVEFFAEQAKQGMKVDKGFKRLALALCARELSNRFGKVITVGHVKTKLAYVKKKFGKLREAMKLSGIGWDNERKFGLTGQVYNDFVGEHPYMKSWLNCSLDNYDDLAIVCSADFATGDQVRSIYMGFGTPATETINIEDDSEPVIQNGQPVPTPPPVAPKPMPRPHVASSSSAKKAKISASKRSQVEEEREMAADKFFLGMTTFANSIIHGPEQWMDKLGREVMGMAAHDYHGLLLGVATETLMRDKVQGMCFTYKTLELRKHWLELYKAKYEAEYGPFLSIRGGTIL